MNDKYGKFLQIEYVCHSMPIQKIQIDEFVNMKSTVLLLDVRSPGEYLHAHIPQAFNLPLFSNEERKIVGTAYKQESRERAIKLGLNFFAPKMVAMVEEVEKLLVDNKYNKSTPVIVHCWRGGMRSAGVAWLLDLYGFNVFTIIGGYKSFRNWTLKQFEITYHFKVVGGYTGSGTTEVLTVLHQKGETIIDLEEIAKHKGSAFGNLTAFKQPSQEMFENLLAKQLYINKDKSIWIEDESQRIGDVNIPIKLYNNKQASTVYFLDIPFDERLKYITKDYGKNDKEKLVNAIIRIKKRLGGLDTKNAINFLLEDDIKNCFAILLKYYDKYYLKGIQSRDNIQSILKTIPCNSVEAIDNTKTLLEQL